MTANKNPRVFSPGVLGNFQCSFGYTLSPTDPRQPGILFTVANPRDQASVWVHIVGFNSESDCLFIISPIVLYLVIVVNHDFSCVVFIQHHEIWLRGTESHRRSSGYEPDEILLLHPASLVTVYLVYGETHYRTTTMSKKTWKSKHCAVMCFTIVPKVEITP